jgi:hypothetical protein
MVTHHEDFESFIPRKKASIFPFLEKSFPGAISPANQKYWDGHFGKFEIVAFCKVESFTSFKQPPRLKSTFHLVMKSGTEKKIKNTL